MSKARRNPVRLDNTRSDNEIDIQVVTTAEQFMHAIAVRAICFMEETGLSVNQTIDGNDYQPTHFVIYAKREPIGATRLRWFRDFAKIERTGFRPAYRNIRILKRTGEVIFRHVAMKGYQLLVTHAEPKYEPLGEDARLRARRGASDRRDRGPRALHRTGQANSACAGGHHPRGRSQNAVPRRRA